MFKKILMAIDLNDEAGATRVAQKAGELAVLSGAELHVLSVVPELGYNLVGAAFGADHSAKMIVEASDALKGWAAKALPEGSAPQIHVMQGTIYDQILRLAGKLEVDAIVVGANRPELRNYLVGPNAARVVRHATQAVLVVR